LVNFARIFTNFKTEGRDFSIIIIIMHEFHRDASLETKLQGRYVSRITLYMNIHDSRIFTNFKMLKLKIIIMKSYEKAVVSPGQSVQ